MATIPTAPSFTGVTTPSMAQLNQLSNCASFLTNRYSQPTWRAIKKGADNVSTAWVTVAWPDIAYDSDGVFATSSSAVIVTKGIYATEASINFGVGAGVGSFNFAAGFTITGGGSNPKLGNGVTAYYGIRSGTTQQMINNVTFAVTPADLTPIIVYPGDVISVVIGTNAFCAVEGPQLSPNVYTLLYRFVYAFSGHWIGNGSATSNTGH